VLAFLWRDLIGNRGSRPLRLLATSLFLGVLLIAACTGLLALIRDGIASEERQLFGGDVELDVREPLDDETLNWIAGHGVVSRLTELRTMMGTEDESFTVIELQSVDEHYPLYGAVQFEPSMSLQDATDEFGAAIDPALAIDQGLEIGDSVTVGEVALTVRALIQGQPDRSFAADVRGPPVLVSQATLDATGLVTPTSLVDYEYRVRLEGPDIDPTNGVFGDTGDFIDAWRNAFPMSTAELNTVEQRNDRVSERLNEVAAVLLLIAVATLLVGGLGVANGVAAWLHARREDLATLSAIGARDGWRARIMVIEVLLVAALTSAVAALLGASIAFVLSRSLAGGLPVSTLPLLLFKPTIISMAFGTLAALAFAAPNLARSLSTQPARLLRGDTDHDVRTPLSARAKAFCAMLAIAAALALIALVPDKIIGIGFVISMVLLYVALSALVIGIMVRLLDSTVPERAPALAFYDIQAPDVDAFHASVASAPGITDVHTVPLVLGRMIAVNGEALLARDEASEALEANDEHKLGYRVERVDNVRATAGALWASDYKGPPLVAMEDREAGQIGVKVGDRLRFSILGETLDAELVAIYAQGNFETRFWFEALFSPGTLDDYITRYVGVAYQDGASDATIADTQISRNAVHNSKEDAELSSSSHPIPIDIAAANAIAADFPAVVTIRTARGLASARRILNAAALAVSIVAITSLVASLLVLASVVAANRQRQLREAVILHAIGSRHGSLMYAMGIEYLLLGIVVALFASVIGGVLGTLVATAWLELPAGPITWLSGSAVAFGIAILCLGAGALWVVRSLRASPAQLLREVG